jgi:leucine dehydrogenase
VALSADRIEHLTGEFEEITYLADPRSGLRAILAVHDTSLGPALGGIRCCAYADEAAALADVLDLARDMTAKVMLAELPAGGGKCVVLDHPGLDRKEAYSRLGDHIDAMRGRFFTAADLGTTVRDLKQVSRRTRFVATPEHGVSEDLAGRAAEGVFLAAGTALDVLGQAEWNGCRIAIQGLGAIGLKLAMLALRAGARVIASDVNAEHAGRAADNVPITLVEPDCIFDADCDVFAPCAHGHVLDATTIPRLRARVVCGAANRQLAGPECGDLLARRGIVYAPDVLVNAGAVISGCGPALSGFDRPRDLSGIGHRLRAVLVESMSTGVPPHRIVQARAQQLLADARARGIGVGA